MQHQIYGGHSMVKRLVRVIVKRPDSVFGDADPHKWHYTAKINLPAAQSEHDDFSKILKEHDVEVLYHDSHLAGLADSIFVHDPVLITNKGVIQLRMGKPLRRGEEDALRKYINSLGVPTLFELHGDATAEGGDTLWLDEHTLAVGRGFRTNAAGIHQLQQALSPLHVKVLPVELPYFQGADACLHLQSLISLVDEKKAAVYLPLLPVSFVELLREKGFDLIEIPEKEFDSMGPNILAIRPGLVLTIEGNPITKQRLEAKGVKVLLYRGNEMSLKAEGGATCLSRPLLRAE